MLWFWSENEKNRLKNGRFCPLILPFPQMTWGNWQMKRKNPEDGRDKNRLSFFYFQSELDTGLMVFKALLQVRKHIRFVDLEGERRRDSLRKRGKYGHLSSSYGRYFTFRNSGDNGFPV